MKRIHFIIGKTKSGKTTLANDIIKKWDNKVIKPIIYEAGSWCIKLFSEKYGEFDSMNQEHRTLIDNIAKEQLYNDPDISFKAFKTFVRTAKAEDIIICGIRNPNDYNSINNMKQWDEVTTTFLKDDNSINSEFDKGVDKIKEIYNKNKKGTT